MPDRYQVTGPIAAGGMAGVWEAHDKLLGRDVAVKVLAEHLNSDEGARQRFQREARAAAGLSSHPNVVTIYDVGEHEGRSYIVMELLRGGTIGDVLSKGRPDPRHAMAWLRSAAEALDAAHEHGVVHRDIKPANLLLDERGRLAVADFGIARIAEEESFTQTGLVLGTAAYLSPEQAVGEPATAASDRYALAAVAFELLTGTRPFEAQHFAAQARAHVEDDAPFASSRAPDLPGGVDQVLCRGLDKEPGRRWPTAAAFVEALEQAIAADPRTPVHAATAAGMADRRHRPEPAPAPPPEQEKAAAAKAGPAPPRRPLLPVGAAAGTDGGRPEYQRHRGRRPNPLLAMAAVLGLLAIGAVVFAGLRGGGTDPSDDRAGRPAAAPERSTSDGSESEGQKAAGAPESETASEAEAPEPQGESAPAAPAATGGEEPPGDDPGRLNAQGDRLFKQGQYAESVPYFQKAVERCGDSAAIDPCAYATFNLGAALNRSGRPKEAIPVLERRLEYANWGSNQPDVVRRELRAACANAGKKCKKV